MMREIKFRAWDRWGKKMLLPPEPIDSSLGEMVFTMDGRCYIEGVYQELILMQYTGLKDKNGKEIYEGDIVKVEDFADHTYYDSIEFDDGCFILTHHGDLAFSLNHIFEVAGNIHETPELLKTLPKSDSSN